MLQLKMMAHSLCVMVILMAPASVWAQTVSNPKVGMTPNKFANEPLTLEVMTQRFNQTIDAGSNFLVGSGEWASIEKTKNSYDFGSERLLVSTAQSRNLPIHFTLRVINTVSRDVPQDLQTTAWNSKQMTTRLNRLIDALAPILKPQVKWFTIGYEIDGYFASRPSELAAFTQLFTQAANTVRSKFPGVKVSTTLTCNAVPYLTSTYAGLNAKLDYLALTYAPLRPDFTVAEPSVAVTDMASFRQAAGSRKLVIQEAAYPSGEGANATSAKQAEFYQYVFGDVLLNKSRYDAVNFMMLADLSNEDTDRFASYYGMTASLAFRATIQTLGVHDMYGIAKPAWSVFRSNALALR